jgi:hypothetical protein
VSSHGDKTEIAANKNCGEFDTRRRKGPKAPIFRFARRTACERASIPSSQVACIAAGCWRRRRSQELVTGLVTTINDTIDFGLCGCELLYRFGLPYKHHLLQAAQTGQALPRTLLHPRWWLHDLDWKPYGQEQAVVISPPRRVPTEPA